MHEIKTLLPGEAFERLHPAADGLRQQQQQKSCSASSGGALRSPVITMPAQLPLRGSIQLQMACSSSSNSHATAAAAAKVMQHIYVGRQQLLPGEDTDQLTHNSIV
jgi:hypothetical protein